MPGTSVIQCELVLFDLVMFDLVLPDLMMFGLVLFDLVLFGALRALEYLLFYSACFYPAPGLRCEH